MRAIRQVDIVTAMGAKSYSVGQDVNGSVIAKFTFDSFEGLTEVIGRAEDNGLVVNIINCPVVIEYFEI